MTNKVEDATPSLEDDHLVVNPDDAQPGERQQSGEVEEAIGEPQMDTTACSVDDSVWEIPSEASEDPDMLKAPKDDGHFCSSELSTLLNSHVEGSISLPALLRAIAKLPRHREIWTDEAYQVQSQLERTTESVDQVLTGECVLVIVLKHW